MAKANIPVLQPDTSKPDEQSRNVQACRNRSSYQRCRVYGDFSLPQGQVACIDTSSSPAADRRATVCVCSDCVLTGYWRVVGGRAAAVESKWRQTKRPVASDHSELPQRPRSQ